MTRKIIFVLLALFVSAMTTGLVVKFDLWNILEPMITFIGLTLGLLYWLREEMFPKLAPSNKPIHLIVSQRLEAKADVQEYLKIIGEEKPCFVVIEAGENEPTSSLFLRIVKRLEKSNAKTRPIHVYWAGRAGSAGECAQRLYAKGYHLVHHNFNRDCTPRYEKAWK